MKAFTQSSSLLVIYWCYPSLTLLSSTLLGPIWWCRWYICFARDIFCWWLLVITRLWITSDITLLLTTGPLKFRIQPSVICIPRFLSLCQYYTFVWHGICQRHGKWHHICYALPATWQLPLNCLCTHSDMGITVEIAVDEHYLANLPVVCGILMLTQFLTCHHTVISSNTAPLQISISQISTTRAHTTQPEGIPCNGLAYIPREGIPLNGIAYILSDGHTPTQRHSPFSGITPLIPTQQPYRSTDQRATPLTSWYARGVDNAWHRWIQGCRSLHKGEL